MRKTTWCVVVLLFFCLSTKAQVSGSFVVKGNLNTYYPVLFWDGGWDSSVATEMTIGRSNVHTDSSWRGAFISKFRFHVTNWGHLANFIDADLRQNVTNGTIKNFVGGWMDCSVNNGSGEIAIWLRGGTTTYYYKSNYTVNPVVYDGVQNSIPLAMSGGPTITSKSTPDNYVDTLGISTANDIKAAGIISSLDTTRTNYFGGSIGIGTNNVFSYKLAVNGAAIFTAAYVKPYTNWPDYVFQQDYQLRPLDSVSEFIRTYHHLPDVPSAENIQASGVDLGGTQAALLKKIEELTLYAIDQDQRIRTLMTQIQQTRAEKVAELVSELDEQKRKLQLQQDKIDRLEQLIASKLK